VRKWPELGVTRDIRLTHSVDHAIFLAFGTTMEPNDLLRFTICTNMGYHTLYATTLYVSTCHPVFPVEHVDSDPLALSASTTSSISATRTAPR
jgi:hypothetical protein